MTSFLYAKDFKLIGRIGQGDWGKGEWDGFERF
jgi:hypothetical protein